MYHRDIAQPLGVLRMNMEGQKVPLHECQHFLPGTVPQFGVWKAPFMQLEGHARKTAAINY